MLVGQLVDILPRPPTYTLQSCFPWHSPRKCSHGAMCDCDTITVAQNVYATYSNAMSYIAHKDVS